ncbi:MAG: 3-deoxy-D-manno-octulosonic acid transferase [Alphaproteobacteria bacterium]
MRPLPLLIYANVSYILQPVANLILSKRLKKGKEDKIRIDERRGRSDLSWRQDPVIWVHAASVGESLSSLTLIHTLAEKYPDYRFVVTTGTTSSAKIMGKKLPEAAVHQFFPVDHPTWIHRFLENWQPELVIFIESEFWPNCLHAIKKRHIPAFLVNGRISDKSFKNWQCAKRSIAYILSTFTECLGQSELDTQRLLQLGAKKVDYLGNLKFAHHHDAIEDLPLSPLEGKNRWLFASTHDGEEEIAANMHLKLMQEVPNIYTCIMPRHAERSDDIEALLLQKGIKVARKSRKEQPIEGCVYLFDVMGQAFEFYNLGGIAVIGRSFAKGGGQNPIEPARAGNIILLGPDMSNFKYITDLMLKNEVAEQLLSQEALYERLLHWLQHPDKAKEQSHKVERWANQLGEGVLERHVQKLSTYLDRIK